MFKPRFPAREVHRWAKEFRYEGDTEIESMAPAIRRRGWLTRKELIRVCRWKTPRSQPQVRKNTESFVREVTSASYYTGCEEFRIASLALLHGVSFPTASVILHFFGRAKYPIIDYRALWSLRSSAKPPYDFPLWLNYTLYCRNLSAKWRVSMRTLDRALWAYSDKYQ